jgi:hypothetical protein
MKVAALGMISYSSHHIDEKVVLSANSSEQIAKSTPTNSDLAVAISDRSSSEVANQTKIDITEHRSLTTNH